jgi:hypothetical protein
VEKQGILRSLNFGDDVSCGVWNREWSFMKPVSKESSGELHWWIVGLLMLILEKDF